MACTHTGDEFDPDRRFCCKMRYWRDGSHSPFKFTYGTEDWRGPTVRERATEARAMYEGTGFEPATRWV